MHKGRVKVSQKTYSPSLQWSGFICLCLAMFVLSLFVFANLDVEYFYHITAHKNFQT